MCRGYTEQHIPEDLYAQVRYSNKDKNWRSECLLKRRDNNEVVARGVAICSSRDNPNRKIGRAIAVGRALKKLDVLRAA